jgi:predicted N-acyltransferase
MPTERVLKAVTSIAEVPAGAWNALANPGGDVPDNPFIAHEFLRALEDSKSAVSETGWHPFHLLLEETPANGKTVAVGAVPMYLKSHSRGEYVFDSGWAEALHRAGGRYYPKLQVSVPFTPATGRRLLVRPGPDADALEGELAQGTIAAAQQLKASSVHFTFLPQAQSDLLGEHGFLERVDQQFHWHNAAYADFDGFLADLTSKHRKNVKRERRDALANGIEIEWVTGSDLREHHWDAFYAFYTDTGSRKWGSPYLTREFFSLVGASMADRVLLIMCRRGGRYIAGAINFIGSDTLFGRNWGCIEDHPFLHFEACYYQAIDFAITHRLARVEAGAQGGHKLARGYLPAATRSSHWIADPRFRDAVARFLKEERRQVERDIEWIDESHTPFRQGVDLAQIRGGRIGAAAGHDEQGGMA